MFNLDKKFSINDAIIDRNIEDKDFAIMELYAISEGNNSHRNPFSYEVLTKKENVDTFKGKFIIGQYDKFTKDTKSHEKVENIYGYVSVDEEPQFKKKIVDGIEKTFVVVKAYISKIYAKEIVDMFRLDNKRSVSCEFSCALQYDEDEYGRPIDENGQVMDCDNPVLAYSISGITILGRSINPSIKGADAIMKRFSEDTNKLELEENTLKGEYMEENKEFSEQPKEEEIVMEESKQEETQTDESKEMEKNVNDSEEKVEEEKEMSCRENKEMGCGDKKMEEQPMEKSFAEQCIECADEDNKEFISKLFSCEVKDIVSKIVELKKFNEQTIKEKTEKRFAEIMVEPKLCLGEKAYNVLFEEGKTLTFSELDNFETKVKAFCEDAPKKQEKKEDELLKFASSDTSNKQEETDVWSRIANS